MSVFDLNIPNLNVNVDSDINKTLVVLRQPAVSLNRSAIPIQNVAESAITASYAVSASNALVAVTALNATIAPGTVSSSQQIINYNKFATTGSNTFKGTQIISASVSWSNGLTIGQNGDNIEITAPPSGTLTILSNDGNRELFVDNSSITVTDMTGSFSANELVLPAFEPVAPVLGSMYFNSQYIYVYDGTQYRSASLN